jgi:hypothetical protein
LDEIAIGIFCLHKLPRLHLEPHRRHFALDQAGSRCDRSEPSPIASALLESYRYGRLSSVSATTSLAQSSRQTPISSFGFRICRVSDGRASRKPLRGFGDAQSFGNGGEVTQVVKFHFPKCIPDIIAKSYCECRAIGAGFTPASAWGALAHSFHLSRHH